MYIPEKSVKLLSAPKTICESKGSFFGYYAWSTMTRLPDGRIACLSSGNRIQHVCPFGKGMVVYSEDDGKSWSAPEILVNTPLDDRDFGVAVSGERVIVTYYNHSVAFIREENEKNNTGKLRRFIAAHLDTIDEEVAEKEHLGAFYILSEDGGRTFGAPKRVHISCPHGPAVLPDGRFLYIGKPYCFIEPTRAHEIKNEPSTLQCWIENEKGEFTYLSSLPEAPKEIGINDETHSIVLPSGKIISHIRIHRFDPGYGAEGWKECTIYQSESTDGGKTFSLPHPILPPMGGAPAHILRLSDGTLVSAYGAREYVDETQKGAICALISRDEGESWESRFITRTNHAWDHGYPSTVEGRDGTLLTAYYDQEKDGNAIIKLVAWSL